jgi:hypothetical protein
MVREQLFAGEHSQDAVELLGGGDVETGDYSLGNLGSEKSPEHDARSGDVVDVLTVSGEESTVLLADDGLAHKSGGDWSWRSLWHAADTIRGRRGPSQVTLTEDSVNADSLAREKLRIPLRSMVPRGWGFRMG